MRRIFLIKFVDIWITKPVNMKLKKFHSKGFCLFSPKKLKNKKIYFNLSRNKLLIYLKLCWLKVTLLINKRLNGNNKLVFDNKNEWKLFTAIQKFFLYKADCVVYRTSYEAFYGKYWVVLLTWVYAHVRPAIVFDYIIVFEVLEWRIMQVRLSVNESN